MMLLTKTIHVLALGLWFGMAIFFSFPVALSLFGSLERDALAIKDRPVWFPLASEFDQDPAHWTVTDREVRPKPLFADRDQLRKDQGTRAAGAVISPLFDWYFLLQGVCGLLALATAFLWWNVRPGRWVHRWRGLLLAMALLTVLIGWLMEMHVSRLRLERATATNEVLRSAPSISGASYDHALQVRADFGRWHFYSLMLNFGTILLVTGAMALAAQLPAGEKRQTPAEALSLSGSPQR